MCPPKTSRGRPGLSRPLRPNSALASIHPLVQALNPLVVRRSARSGAALDTRTKRIAIIRSGGIMTRCASLGRTVGPAIALLGLLCACAGPSAIYDKPQSHFSFPNSNVQPIGPVRAEVSKTNLFFPDVGNPNLEQDAVRHALSEKGGDLLINGRYFWSSTYFYLLIPIYSTTLVVEGEAATMQIGRQVPAQQH
jgi:hypothetical protein